MSKEKCHSCGKKVYYKTSPHGRNYCPNCGTITKDDQRDVNLIELIEK